MSPAELLLGPGPLEPEGVAPAPSGLAGLFEVAPTPGPWHTDGDVVWAGIAAPGICMTVEPPVGVHFAERPEAERHANARLIAAAPDMLEALQRGVAVLKDGVTIPQLESWVAYACAAIALAEGRS